MRSKLMKPLSASSVDPVHSAAPPMANPAGRKSAGENRSPLMTTCAPEMPENSDTLWPRSLSPVACRLISADDRLTMTTWMRAGIEASAYTWWVTPVYGVVDDTRSAARAEPTEVARIPAAARNLSTPGFYHQSPARNRPGSGGNVRIRRLAPTAP